MATEAHYSPGVAIETGGRFGEFELLERIGRGTVGEVWRARTATNRRVALKIILPALARRPHFVTLFEKETSGLTALNHPTVLAASDRGRLDGFYYIASELMLQGSLREAMQSGPIPAARAVRIACRVCEALDYGHRRGLPHGHLVPENVFFTGDDQVRVSDFGLTRLAGRPVDLGDAAADLMALGGLIHELVTGSPPPRRYEKGCLPEISARLDDVLARALASDQAKRFSRATEMNVALLLAASDASPAAAPESTREALQTSVEGKVLSVTLTTDATPQGIRAALPAIERTLGSGGGWRLSYDLSALTVLDAEMQEPIMRLHARYQRNIDRVAFCSPRALVRSGALVVGKSIVRLPWRIFSSPVPMRVWLDQAEAT